jgi:hypothetical protein
MGAVPGGLVLRYSTNGEEGCKGWKEVILDVILVVNLILEIVVFFLLWGGEESVCWWMSSLRGGVGAWVM